MRKRISWNLEKVVEFINSTDNEYVSGKYKNMSSGIVIKCSCGSKYEKTFTKFYHRGQQNCPECSWNRLRDKRRKTTEQFTSEMLEKWGTEFTVLGEYEKNSTPILVRHNSIMCNFREYYATPYAILGQGKGCKECYFKSNTGSNNPSWNPKLTDEERVHNRDYPEYYEWRLKVYERDNFTCQKCLSVAGRLNAHHIENYADNPSKRLDVSNGCTLCETCHRSFHMTHGYRNTNSKQLKKFLNS